ncbi:MAG: WecB/TagA/CpsF family glycosyltransferase [Anaerolineae bacterium]|nr:WecB/TagA/CpsF family glycosyltransferase [Anaerolineae bacterium]
MRILVVQLADVGDLVLATPALAALRAARPDARLTLLTSAHAAPLVADSGLVDAIVTLDRASGSHPFGFLRPDNLRRMLAPGRQDLVIYLHHFTLWRGTLKFALIALAARAGRRIGLDNGNAWFLTEKVPDNGFGAMHQAEYWLQLAARAGADPRPRPALVARGALSQPLPPGRYIALHAGGGASNPARRWAPQRFAQVADRLREETGAQLVLVGGPGDDNQALRAALRSTVIDLTGQTTLPQLAQVLGGAALFIGAESGVMHLAAAAGAPVLAIMGPGNAFAWGPWTPAGRSVVLRSAPACSPCGYVGHSLGLPRGCEARTCMRMVTPALVLEAARALLRGESPSAPADDRGPRPPGRIHILGLPVDGLGTAQWLALVEAWLTLRPRRARQVCTMNPEFMMAARGDVNFRHILQRADLCVADGAGLLWAARRRGMTLPGRITGADGVPLLAQRAASRGWRLFLLGAAPGVAERAAQALQTRFPGLQIAGTFSGSPAADEEDDIVARVNASQADLLFVAWGAPRQEKWIARNLPRLQVGMAMGVGGTLDYLAGDVRRAPQWLRRRGLEWLFRLALQPWRLRRMLRLPRFVLAVLLERRAHPQA